MQVIYDDGGRAAAGFKGMAGDCVTRAIYIATGFAYKDIYQALANIQQSKTGKKSARNGIDTKRPAFKRYMESLGFSWVPCMGIGTGCKVHLNDGELPDGRLVVSVSKHYTAVIDGVIHDTQDPQRHTVHMMGNTKVGVTRRCVYGYWVFNKPGQGVRQRREND